jgi:hypothetical protein
MRLAVAVALTLFATTVLADPVPSNALQLKPDAIKWMPGSAQMPAGTQVAVLEGDPKAKTLFTLRLKVPAGSRLAPHWHPRDERVTVISGLVGVGFGDRIDDFGVARFPAGSFYVNPSNSRHYVVFPEESVVQVTGIGPWEINFVTTPAATPPGAEGAKPVVPGQ